MSHLVGKTTRDRLKELTGSIGVTEVKSFDSILIIHIYIHFTAMKVIISSK